MKTLMLTVIIVVGLVVSAGIGFLIGRETVDNSTQTVVPPERLPRSAPTDLVSACDKANGIWLDRYQAQLSELNQLLPGYARVPGCYRQLGPATAWTLDLSYSTKDAGRWARSNGLPRRT